MSQRHITYVAAVAVATLALPSTAASTFDSSSVIDGQSLRATVTTTSIRSSNGFQLVSTGSIRSQALGAVTRDDGGGRESAERETASRLERQLEEIRNLQVGWDSYGGQPPTQAALAIARSLLDAIMADVPHALDGKAKVVLTPGGDGSIQLEAFRGDRLFEADVAPDGDIEVRSDSYGFDVSLALDPHAAAAALATFQSSLPR